MESRAMQGSHCVQWKLCLGKNQRPGCRISFGEAFTSPEIRVGRWILEGPLRSGFREQPS